MSTMEWAVGSERLDTDGAIWRAEEDDPAADRECAAPFMLCPFKGRYVVEDTTPDLLSMQVRCPAAGRRRTLRGRMKIAATGVVGRGRRGLSIRGWRTTQVGQALCRVEAGGGEEGVLRVGDC